MGWKTLGIKGILVSVRQRMSNMFRSIRGLGNVSSPAPTSYETTTPLADMHLSITNYSLEAELKKAEALDHWRKWDRPK